MTDRPDPPKYPSHPTVWAPGTIKMHKRAREKLGTKADTQIVRHEDLYGK